MRIRVLDELRPMLDASGLPWYLDSGSKHIKLMIAGRMAGIISHGGKKARSEADRRTILNLKRHIKDVIHGVNYASRNNGVSYSGTRHGQVYPSIQQRQAGQRRDSR